MYVGDEIADEIDKTQGLKGTQDVWIHEDPVLNHTTRYKADGVHSFIWGATPRYARAWEEFEERRRKRLETEGTEPSEVTDGRSDKSDH